MRVSRPRRLVRWLLITVGAISAVGLIAVVAITLLFRASLPTLDGPVTLAGLSAAVTVERDARGLVVLRAGGLEDLAAAQGFVHAQDRFFQMDVLRRFSAGRLSELFGAAALPLDKQMRPLGFDQVAAKVVEQLPPDKRALLAAYARGVNAGVASLGARPPEYFVFFSRADARPWVEADTVLVLMTMWHNLSMGRGFELSRDGLRAALPPEAVDFLMPERGPFDRPMQRGTVEAEAPPPVPGPGVFDVGAAGETRVGLGASGPDDDHPSLLGSNNWAISASRSASTRAIMANDMHLGLDVPNTWYRVQYHWTSQGKPRRAAGVSLPGAPGIIVGATDDLAWGFTNLTGDLEDHVVIEPDSTDAARYLTPDGPMPFEVRSEPIAVGGGLFGRTEPFQVRSTRWGPIVAKDAKGRELALRWTALIPECVNLRVLDLIEARTLEEGVRAAREWGGPPQNVVFAAQDGRVAWTISGLIPVRAGFDGRAPVSWTRASVGWTGWLPERDRPVLIDPPSGMVFSANNRTLEPARSRLLSYDWGSGERAARIVEALEAAGPLDERKMLAVQLDTQSAVGALFRGLVLEVVPEDEPAGPLARARVLAAAWNGKADTDQAAYTLHMQYRGALRSALFDFMLAKPRQSADFRYRCFMRDDVLRRLLEERPPHLLPPAKSPAAYSDWPGFLRVNLETAVAEVERRAKQEGLAGFEQLNWGRVNRPGVRHQISKATGWFGSWLDMPDQPVPGDETTVRVQGRGFGASQRLVVSPAQLEDGVLHMPGGQSGHFLSPWYRDGHQAWVTGERTRLLAGPAAHRLTLTPN